jgi:8-oxo-dGTP pyrophosphatase MutT (NUDIX family)
MRTRASAYVLAIHDGHILLTQLAEYCTNAGHWGLPGGGIHHGEQPEEAVVRETFEEAGLHAKDVAIYHSRTYSETGERGDFLAVQVIYTATLCGEPSVQEVGGSTADVRWVPLTEVAELPTLGIVDAVLGMLAL